MAINFRDHSPIRTCTKKYANYQSFKSYLATDFKNKCGYTNCSDFWFGGSNNFHIDHFIPWKANYATHPNLKTDYSNLVYACSFVNILKSDNPASGFLDPCNVDYNQHFRRDKSGKIIPLTATASDMFDKLKMDMDRYRLIWMLDRLAINIEKLKLRKIRTTDTNKLQKINSTLQNLYEAHYEYVGYLKAV